MLLFYIVICILQTGQTDQQKYVVVSIAPQCRASLAAKYKLSVPEAAGKLTGFFKRLGMIFIFS
jgi:iron only hydrogenase large subunit-like protein